MGLPINKLVCASNENKVLFDFFRTGTYDRKRDFILTTSPSMDILISSNLERLIYRLTGEDAQKCAELMQSLGEGGEDVYKRQVIKPSQYYTDKSEGVRTFRSLNIGAGFIKDIDWVYFTKEGHQKNSKSILKKDDLLIVRSRCV